MATIVGYLWDFGDGTTSTQSAPQHVFNPGTYDVSLTITYDNGDTVLIEEDNFIIVADANSSILGPAYIDRPKSFNYGINKSYGVGWSKNTGDDWIYPESQACIIHRTIDGVDHLIVWDMWDGKPYVINTRNTAYTFVSHLDKGTTEIVCKAKFGAVTGESKSLYISHQESLIHIKKDVDVGYRVDPVLTTRLYGEWGAELESARVNADREVVFKTQSTFKPLGEHRLMQLEIESDRSGFVLAGVDSVYKVIDKSALSSRYTQADPDERFASVLRWLTRTNGYEVDLGTGDAIDAVKTLISGPDGGSDTGVWYDVTVSLGNPSTTGSVFFVANTQTPSINVGVVAQKVKTVGSWSYYLYSGSLNVEIEIPGTLPFFDFRVTDTTITTDDIDVYASRIDDFIGG